MCKAWETLAQGGGGGVGKIPIGHWLPVTKLAIGGRPARPPKQPAFGKHGMQRACMRTYTHLRPLTEHRK